MTKRGRFSYAVETAKTAALKEKSEQEVIEVLAENKQKSKKPIPAKKSDISLQSVPAETLPTADLATAAQAALQNPAAYALPPQRRGWRGARPGEEEVIKRMDVPREQLNVRVRPELKRAAAARAALSGLTLGDVVETALIAYLDAANK